MRVRSLGPLSASPSDGKFSYDASASYALDKNTNVYVRYANGFRGSSVQGAGAFNEQSVAKAETNDSIEAGIKAAGKMRMEGKEYVVQDGDIMHFLFNV